MKAEELRIGNWYRWYAEGKYYEYQVIQSDFSNDCNFLNFEPIPLTEEWLEKFKIGSISPIIENDGIINKAMLFKCFPIFYWNDGSITIEINDFSKVKLNYVHQIQNLHFALTGQELTIK
jgi:hypothetical protein